ncbi:DNA repair protein RAD51-like protein 3, partial [Larimichthys crocea]
GQSAPAGGAGGCEERGRRRRRSRSSSSGVPDCSGAPAEGGRGAEKHRDVLISAGCSTRRRSSDRKDDGDQRRARSGKNTTVPPARRRCPGASVFWRRRRSGVYIDTEGGFLLQRVVDIAAAAVRHCSLLVEDDEQRVAIDTFTVETVLSNMFLVRCHDYVELLAELHLLSDFLSNHPRVRLLVIDSVACPFRKHFDELSQRTRLLNGLALQLIAMATSHEIAVVITNQMTTRVHGSQSQLVPALGIAGATPPPPGSSYSGWGHIGWRPSLNLQIT